MHRIYTSIPKRKLRVLYGDRGFSLRSIARIYHCDPGVIARALRKYGITIRRPTASVSFDDFALRTLYSDRKLSTYQIAKQYGCDPKTVYRYLKRSGIPTRRRRQITLTKSTLRHLYLLERKSLDCIAKERGYSAAGILNKLKLYQIERRSLSEAGTKHQKTDFNGDQKEKAYTIGFRLGDLGVRKRGNLIYISSGTTKIAQSKLIHDLFYSYGPVWIGKRNKRGAMNVSCSLNNSFSFLLPKHARIPEWIRRSPTFFFAFVAGYTDAEGNISITNGRARFRIRSYDKGILRDIKAGLERSSIRSLFSLDRKAGIDARGARRNKDCWSVIINEKQALYRLFIMLLPLLRHEKRKKDTEVASENVAKRLAT
ncbi:MAG: hypothetical protein Q7S50_03700 [bacterium]|nr:hypothetical protein [bacterium]